MDQRGTSTLENQRLWSSLHESVRHQLPNAHDAEDVVQDSFVRALECPPREERALGAWLRTVARHLSSRRRSSHRARRHREEQAARSERLPSFERDLMLRSVRDDLEREIERLPRPYREVVRLRYFEELETEEVALRLGRSPGTVRVQLKRGLDRMRRDMQAGGRERWRLGSFLFAWLPSTRRGAAVVLPGAAVVASVSLGVWLALTPDGAPRVEPIHAASSAMAAPPKVAVSPAATTARTTRVEGTDPGRVAPLPPRSPAAFTGTVDVQGVVLGPDGPAPQAELVLSSSDPYDPGQVIGTADDGGAFHLENVPADAWLSARLTGASPSLRHLAASAVDGRLDLRLRGVFGRLVGRVLGPDGLAAANAVVRVETPRILRAPFVDEQRTWSLSTPPQLTRTDDRGEFELTRFEIGPERLVVVTAEGAGWAGWIEPDQALAPFEIRCEAQAVLHGNLRDETGRPAAGRRVRLELPLPFEARTVTTDERGDFTLSPLPPGPYRLWVEASARTPDSVFVAGELAAGEAADLRLELSSAAVIRGTLITERGSGDGTVVRLFDPSDWRASLLGTGVPEEDRLPPLVREARVDHRGRFLFAGLPADVPLVLHARDAEGRWALRRCDLRAGEPEIALQPVQALQAEFLVRFHGPAELLPDWVEARSEEDGRTTHLAVSADGVLRSGPLAPGSYRLHGWTRGLGSWPAGRVTLEPGVVREIDYRVTPPGSLRLTLELPPDTATGDIQAVLMSQGYHALLRDAFTGDPPTLELTLLHGNYVLLLRAPGLAPEQVDIAIDAGRTSEHTVRLSHGANTKVSIRAPEALAAGLVAPRAEIEVYVDGAAGTAVYHFFRIRAEDRDPDELAYVPIPLRADTRGVRVVTSDGLSGEWTAPAGLAPPEQITIELR